MVGPRFTGVPHESVVVARWETQRSRPPWAPTPDRLLVMYRLRPSGLIAGCWSLNVELTTGVGKPASRLTGVLHAPKELSSTQRDSSTSNAGLTVGRRVLCVLNKAMTKLSWAKAVCGT